MKEQTFLKQIILSKDDMDRFEKKKEMKKIIPVENTWYDWLIFYNSEPIRKSIGGLKGKIISLFKTEMPKQTVYGRRKKLRELKKRNIKIPFISDEIKEKKLKIEYLEMSLKE